MALLCSMAASCNGFVLRTPLLQSGLSKSIVVALPPRALRLKSASLLGSSLTMGVKTELSLAMVTHAGQIIATSTVLGGALAGGLHAITGPDHYPALLPRCVGKRWLPAGKIGAMWGVGHALSAMCMGMCAFLIKDKAFVPGGIFSRVAFGADVAIGLSLILIGLLSIQEAKGVDFKQEMSEARSSEKQTLAMKANVLINGIFHGLSLDGIPTLMPVLGATSVKAAVSFLLAYGLGVTAAMVAATVFIGHGTMSLAKTTDFDLSKLIHGSAVAAVIIGVAWTGKALLLA